MKSKLRPYLFLIGQVAAGILPLVLVQQLKVSANIKTTIIFTAFLLLNLLYARVFDLTETLRKYWSLRKLPYLLVGTFAGLLLAIIPIVVAIAAGKLAVNSVSIDKISIASVFLTFLIVGWEELWFRGLLLNQSSKYVSEFDVSLMMGLLFMLVHMLNPEISLLRNGPVLFLAGTLLTSLYFCSRNIWLPAGLHFGNNFFGSVINTGIKSNLLFGSEGYIYTGILLLTTLFFLLRLRKSRYRQ